MKQYILKIISYQVYVSYEAGRKHFKLRMSEWNLYLFVPNLNEWKLNGNVHLHGQLAQIF